MALTFYLLAVIAAAALIVRLAKRRSIKLPPGPPGLPIIGNLFDLPPSGSRDWEHWHKLREQYGPITSLSVPGNTIVVLHDFDSAFEVLEKKCGYSSNRPELTMAFDLCGWGKNLALQQDHNGHRVGRKQFRNFIGTPALVARFDDILDMESHRFLHRVLKDPQTLREQIRKLAGAIILNMAYGYTVDNDGRDPLVELIEDSLRDFNVAAQPGAFLVDIIPWLRYLPSWLPGTEFKRIAAATKASVESSAHMPFDFVQRQIAQGKAAPSFVSSLKDKDGDEEMQNAVWTAQSMFAGGADTTVVTISIFFLAMMLHPEVQAEAQQEVLNVVGEDRLPSASDRDQLPHVEALVKECLRWHPVLPSGVPHYLTADYEYAGYTLPKGATVIPNAWSMAHDPSVYKDPFTFSPSRFLGPQPERDPQTFIFGFGRRVCPGRILAHSSIFLTIARALAILDIRKLLDGDGKVIEPKEPYFAPGLISHPAKFEVDIQVRSEKARELVEGCEGKWPMGGVSKGEL